MITFKWECPESVRPYTAVKSVVHEIEPEATRDELCEAFTDFLRGIGYHLNENSSVQIVEDDVEYTPKEVYPAREDIPAEYWGKPIMEKVNV